MTNTVSTMQVSPVTLTGIVVELRPLELSHAAALYEALSDDELWHYLPGKTPTSVRDWEAMIAAALEAQADSTEVPLVTVHRETGDIAGTSRFLDISSKDRHAEIGWTIVSPKYLRSAVNTEA